MSVPQIVNEGDTARARLTDPVTSHEAADRADTAASRREVVAILTAHGACSDEHIHGWHRYSKRSFYFAPSRLRTARKELVGFGVVVEAGEGVTSKGRRCKTWTLV